MAPWTKRNVLLVLNIGLLVLIVVSFVTGWIASWLSLTELGIHKYSSIGFVLVAGAHLGLHWRALAAHARRLLSGASALAKTGQ